MSEFVGGSLIHDRYLLQARLANESTGGRTVWSGKDTLLDRPVHIYVISEDVSQHLDRARAASQHAIATVARIYAIETAADVGVVVTEAPDGIDLEALHTGSPVDVGQARAIVGTAAEALAEAAKHGIFHEDLTAKSIVRTAHGISVTGLGIASGDLPPEQRTDQVRSREDAIALLKVFYLLVTGEIPSSQAPDLSDDLNIDSAIRRAVHTALHSPDEAPPSAQLVAQVMMPWSEIEPLSPGLATTHTPLVETPEPAEDFSRKSVLKPAPARPSVKRTSTKSPATGGTAAAGVAGAAAAGVAAATAAPSAPAGTPAAAPPDRTSVRTPQPAASAPVAPAPQQPHGRVLSGTSSAPIAALNTDETRAELAKYRLPPVHSYGPPPAPTGPAAVRDPFNITPWIVVAFIVVLVLFGRWAINTVVTPQHHGAPVSSRSEAPPPPLITEPPLADSDAVEPTEEPAEEPTQDPGLQLPVILNGTQLDPYGDDNEHPEAVDLAWDNDTSTYWYTRTYNQLDMGPKPGIGYHVQFTTNAYFSSITLNTNSVGGHVEIRATSIDEPEEGTLLWSGGVDGVTTINLNSPAETDEIVLWWTELPVSDWGNRLELNEISFS